MLPNFVSAQYAETLSGIAESQTVSLNEALWLVGSAAGSLGPSVGPAEAIEALSGLNFELTARSIALSDQPVGNAQFAKLLMQIEETGAGFWYGVLPSRLTAFAYLQREGVFPAEARPNQRISGRLAIDVLRGYLALASEGQEIR